MGKKFCQVETPKGKGIIYTTEPKSNIFACEYMKP